MLLKCSAQPLSIPVWTIVWIPDFHPVGAAVMEREQEDGVFKAGVVDKALCLHDCFSAGVLGTTDSSWSSKMLISVSKPELSLLG